MSVSCPDTSDSTTRNPNNFPSITPLVSGEPPRPGIVSGRSVSQASASFCHRKWHHSQGAQPHKLHARQQQVDFPCINHILSGLEAKVGRGRQTCRHGRQAGAGGGDVPPGCCHQAQCTWMVYAPEGRGLWQLRFCSSRAPVSEIIFRARPHWSAPTVALFIPADPGPTRQAMTATPSDHLNAHHSLHAQDPDRA